MPSPDPCHNLIAVACSRNKKAPMQGFFMDGTGLEPVTPSLSIWCSRSRQCAGVRSDSIVEPNPKGHRTVERTRTNTDPSILATLCCHLEAAVLDLLFLRSPSFWLERCHAPRT